MSKTEGTASELDAIIVGQNIKKLLKEKNITQAEFADMVGVMPVTVSRWVTGRIGNMPVSKFYQVAEALGTTMDGLL